MKKYEVACARFGRSRQSLHLKTSSRSWLASVKQSRPQVTPMHTHTSVVSAWTANSVIPAYQPGGSLSHHYLTISERKGSLGNLSRRVWHTGKCTILLHTKPMVCLFVRLLIQLSIYLCHQMISSGIATWYCLHCFCRDFTERPGQSELYEIIDFYISGFLTRSGRGSERNLYCFDRSRLFTILVCVARYTE